MSRILFAIIGLLLLSSCGNTEKIIVTDIRKIYFAPNNSAQLNFGNTVQGRFMAELNSGREVDVSDNRKFTFESSDIIRDNAGDRFIISKKPNSLEDKLVSMTLSYADKGETFQNDYNLEMNFKGDLMLLLGGQDGENGVDQRDRGSKLIGRNGKDGENGTDGQAGGNAGSYTIYIWQKSDTAFVLAKDQNTGAKYYYKSISSHNITIDISGGDGGKGGDGGDGGDGKDGKISDDNSTDPGDGGNGGNGGNGANGGNGGSVQVFLHPNATRLQASVNYMLAGGKAGAAGAGGKGGVAGKALSGQNPGTNGNNGTPGISGLNGSNALYPSVSVQEFNPDTL